MARLHEYQGKAILAANGFKIPRGRAASTKRIDPVKHGYDGPPPRSIDSTANERK
jgi:succinyl-CoA synthetase beta subunit